jgi:hypothetical protein
LSMAGDEHITAQDASFRRRGELMASERCGCFYCLEVFAPKAIVEWADDEQTALCPHCGIDSVIGSSSGHPIDQSFLRRMKEHWFASRGPVLGED